MFSAVFPENGSNRVYEVVAAGGFKTPAVRGAEKLAVTLRNDMSLALLFRRIATIETDVPVGTVDDWAWTGPTSTASPPPRPGRFPAPRRRPC